MTLPDDLDTPEWQRRRNAQLSGDPDATTSQLNDDLPADVWQRLRARQVGDVTVGAAWNGALAGGGGADRIAAAPAAPAFDVDREFLAKVEGKRSEMYVPTYDSGSRRGQVIGKSGPTIGVGVDLGQKDLAYLNALKLSPQTVSRLAPYLGKRGQAALAFVKANPLELSERELGELNSSVQDREIGELARKFDTASQVGRFQDLPRDTRTAIASLYFQYGTAAPERRTPNYWRQITTGDWEGAYANLMAFQDGHPERREAEAGRLRNDIRSGKLPRRLRASPGG